MIDNNGYRSNVGIVICNIYGQVLWARRYKQNSWQFPQGGIRTGETPEEAMYRELFEEVGLKENDVRFLSSIPYWLRYKLPNRLIRVGNGPSCIGQKQKWFLLQVLYEKNINTRRSKYCEFDDWRWVSFWYPLRNIVFFKRNVYRRMMSEFYYVVMTLRGFINTFN